MDSFLSTGVCNLRLFGILDAHDGISLLCACRDARNAAKPMESALAFAMTRLRSEEFTLSLQVWSRLWSDCCEAAKQEGLQPAVFADALTYHEEIDEREKVSPMYAFPLLKLTWELAQNHRQHFIFDGSSVQITAGLGGPAPFPSFYVQNQEGSESLVPLEGELAAVLSMCSTYRYDGRQYYDFDEPFYSFTTNAMVALTDGQVALLWTTWSLSDEVKNRSAIFIGDNVCSLLLAARRDPARSIWESSPFGRLQWREDWLIELNQNAILAERCGLWRKIFWKFQDEQLSRTPSRNPSDRTNSKCRLVDILGQHNDKTTRFCNSNGWLREEDEKQFRQKNLRELELLFQGPSRKGEPCSAGVTQDVHHEEPPARIPEHEAELMSHELWATAIHRMSGSVVEDEAVVELDTLVDSDDQVQGGDAFRTILANSDNQDACIHCVDGDSWLQRCWHICMTMFNLVVGLRWLHHCWQRIRRSMSNEIRAIAHVEVPASEVEPAPVRSGEFDVIFLVKFTRAGKPLQKALHGRALEVVRAAAKSAGYDCRLERSGASVFLYPDQYDVVLSSIPDHSLRPHHVLIAEAFLPLLKEEITKLSSKSNVRQNSSRPVAFVDDAENAIIVEHTFLNIPRVSRRAHSVTQSSTDAHYRKNPRRLKCTLE